MAHISSHVQEANDKCKDSSVQEANDTCKVRGNQEAK